ncbi:glycerophosphodiester phosphodiesterase [Bacillus massiliglaciei]|uniref:glycerophosphodiester phosphodiesterase n=1 Tax=Bacillus massiliglaciei TaxID=1816693 RepID=UPI000A63CC70|nr:glycerophosphodiester phosphodiesterase [Bacillus massiliglaciei]
MNRDIQIFAHRGSKGTHPENTMAAFKEAERAGADGIEFDVHMSRDGQLVIIHDEKLDRTTFRHGLVKDYDAEELTGMDAGSFFAKEYESERIPLLEEVFEWAVSNKLKMNVEIKTDKIAYEGIEEKIIDLIGKYHLEERIILSSFNHTSLDKARSINPQIERALLFQGLPANIVDVLKHAREKGFHPDRKSLTKEIIQNARELGYKVRPWVANKKNDLLLMKQYGVDAVITDYPERALALLKDHQ